MSEYDARVGGLCTCRLICAKINYFTHSYVYYDMDNNKFIIKDTGSEIIYYNCKMLEKFILYVWDNIFDVQCDIYKRFLWITINSRMKIKIYSYYGMATLLKFILGYGPNSNMNYIVSVMDNNDKKILYRIWLLVILVDDNILNKDIMRIILDKLFF